MTVLSYGDRALLVELGSTEAVIELAALVSGEAEVAGLVEDVVPGARTLLLVAGAGVSVDRLRAALSELGEAPSRLGVSAARRRSSAGRRAGWGAGASSANRREVAPSSPAAGGREVVVPVAYDGADLDVVARLTGLSVEEVVAAHTGTSWRVAFGGFAPGFAYLVGGDPRLQVPRRDTPRTAVPAGSVGLAGEFSGVYPRESPGGWQLIGRTDEVMWDVDREPPALLAPGATVRFVEA
ncbi:allophanate hydrolase subunit 1 [Nocardioides thalensis]|uniref:Allophanate hydrolase subunit 1 n=1 Tax=Nocardioides thalensis TaxID=1914755 RepID=A0A853C400_9ACTN|nr:allophanate hydrolase subunit 1 [Nocardioides thalensis]NYJ02029.1 allophanate hydrolase subunit 1 [Nocardioides thalensis]